MGLGIDVHLLAEAAGTSAAQVIANTVVGDYTELDTLARFAEDIDVLTFDHEHVPTRHLRELGSAWLCGRARPRSPTPRTRR